jgi:hypothetical protein
VHDMHVNSPSKFGSKPHRYTVFFAVYFATSLYLIHFDRDKSNQLRDVVTLVSSSL